MRSFFFMKAVQCLHQPNGVQVDAILRSVHTEQLSNTSNAGCHSSSSAIWLLQALWM